MMTFHVHSVRFLLIAMLMSAVSVHGFAGITTVSLRSTVRISGDDPITLGQLGEIEGDQAELLAGVSIEELIEAAAGQWESISKDDLRALINACAEINAGSVVINGPDVSVRRSGVDAPVSAATQRATDDHSDKKSVAGPVVRNHVERWVRDRYKVGTDLLRISYRDIDEAFLSTSTEGRLVEIKEISKRGRTAIRVIVLDDLMVASEQALLFDVEIFRTVLVARERVNRGSVLNESVTMSDRRWVSPEEHAADADEAMGMALSKTINEGQMIESQHIELPLVIRRGDIVSAKSIAGSVVVTVRGRAKSNARLGETIEIESMNGDSQFRAKATGKGRAAILKDQRVGDQS
tara:strand:- start:126149 stop:127198 length:1050 start_codon:yes stop_codon:yes gene_type:complete